MSYAKLIPFDRPLSGATLPGQKGRFVNESELAALEQEAFHRGVDAARAKVDQQIVELRSDMQNLGDGVFRKLSTLEATLANQLREALPALALEIARRLLAGYEPSPEVVSRICEEALGELFPERENLELVVSAHDAALLEKLNPAWISRYPGLRIRTEPTFTPGDCQVRSRFGLTDARLQTKLAALEHNLLPS
ncbi:MAG: flagellar biosynthesis protein [Verrucomicrobia bacterium]|nr:flagellar biosynthesis protein [Verrucomicrobiota bacterium]